MKRFLLPCLWFYLPIFRTSYCHDFDHEDEKYLLFSSRHLLAKKISFSIVFSNWRSFSHLHPFLHRQSTVILFCYWLLLLAGDVAVNSGPVKYPSSQFESISEGFFVTDVISGSGVSRPDYQGGPSTCIGVIMAHEVRRKFLIFI